MDESPARAILTFLFQHPTGRFSLRDLARETPVALGTVAKYVRALEAEGLVLLEKRPNALYVSANVENERFRQLKRTSSLQLLYDSGLADRLAQDIRPECVVLFGSYAEGRDTEESDIDLAVIGGRASGIDRKPFEKTLGREINIVRLKSAEGAAEQFIHALVNGIVLSGSLELSYGLRGTPAARKGEKNAIGRGARPRTP